MAAPHKRLTMIDLNEEPDENNGDPVYSVQHAAGNTEFVAESPNPPIIQKSVLLLQKELLQMGTQVVGCPLQVIHKYLQQ
ncbi:hypothetical protein D1007_02255 [Hordeum vulgare]|nr:hypothetical protein D1007_02255 [Hordeum vulgare]